MYDTIEPVDLQQYMREFDEQNQVVPAFMYSGQVKDYFRGNIGSGSQMPWSKTHGKVSFREGETSIWAGYNGSGKSMLLGQVMMGVMQQGETACIASMEMRPHVTIARMCRQASGVNIPSEQFIEEFHEWLSGKLWMYVQQGTVKHQRMLALSRYCGAGGILSAGKKIPIKHLVIDSLMKCGIKVDDYNTQKDFIDSLTSIAKDTGIHIHLVCHMRKGDSEFREGDKMDIKGASELSDQVDNVFLLSRNKLKEDELVKPNPNEKVVSMPDAILACRKQRNGEWEGKIALWFDKKSLQYVGQEGARPIDFVKAA